MKADSFLNRSDATSESRELREDPPARPAAQAPAGSGSTQASTGPVPPATGLLSITAFIVVLSLMTGLYSLCSLAAFMYQKELLGLSPSTIQLLSGLLSIPWGFKFLFGYSYDALIPTLGKSKHLILIVSAVRVLLFLLAFALPPRTLPFFLILLLSTLCGLYENIVAECQLVVMSKEDNRRNPDQKANHLPLFFGCRAAGQLVGGFFGGRIITHLSIRAAFLICAFLPLVVMLACLLYDEAPVPPRPVRSFTQEWQILRSLVCRDKVIPMLVFVCLINATPSFDSINTFYQTDVLGFSMDDLANFSSFSTLCYIAGLVLYSLYLRRFDPHNFFIATNFLLWAVNVSFLLVVLGLVAQWGLSVRLFCLLNFGTYSFVSEINFMPIIAIWCAICPPSLEATSITLLTAFINFSSNLGTYLGALTMLFLRVDEHQFGRLWLLLVIQNVYLILAIVGVLFVPFPDPSKEAPPPELLPLTQKAPYDIDFYSAD